MWWRKKTDHLEQKVLRCSFCNKWQHDVERLIAGPKIFICDECVEVCNDIIADDKRVSKPSGAAGGAKADEPLSWPSEIQCALCHTSDSACRRDSHRREPRDVVYRLCQSRRSDTSTRNRFELITFRLPTARAHYVIDS